MVPLELLPDSLDEANQRIVNLLSERVVLLNVIKRLREDRDFWFEFACERRIGPDAIQRRRSHV